MILPFILLLFYFLFILIVLIKPNKTLGHSKSTENVSVIVAFKDESENLTPLLASLLNQTYTKERVEYIFVDDRSSDHSSEIISRYLNQFKDAKLFRIETLPEGKFGKKNALEMGISESTHDILLFTDADCVCDPNWIESTLSLYDQDTACVVGKSYLTPIKSTFVCFFQEAESVFNHFIAERSISYNFPVMSFGRNFSYRKSAFEKIDGFKDANKSLSGDDDLILAAFRKAGLHIKFNYDTNVLSKTVSTWHEFLVQKTRHMSVSRFLPLNYQFFALLFHGTHFALITSILFGQSVQNGFIFMGLKLLTDFVLFSKMRRILKYSPFWRVYIMWSFGYWIYVPILTLLSYKRNVKKLTWK